MHACMYVYSSMCIYVCRQSQVVVRLAHVGGVLPGESSLGELRLLPRATLVATTLTAADRDSSFKQVSL
jgi:hypothetical protein